jgi:hypothetical protein
MAPEGVAGHRVPVDPERPGQQRDVRRHLRERPGLTRGVRGPPLGPLVDEHKPEPVGQGVQVVAPHVVVGPGTPVEADQWRPGPALHDEERCVADVYQPSCNRC